MKNHLIQSVYFAATGSSIRPRSAVISGAGPLENDCRTRAISGHMEKVESIMIGA